MSMHPGRRMKENRVLLVSVEGPPDVVWKLSDKEVTMHIELA